MLVVATSIGLGASTGTRHLTTTVEELAQYLECGFDQHELENAFDLYDVGAALHLLLNGYAVAHGGALSTFEFELGITMNPQEVAEFFLLRDAEYRLRTAGAETADERADEEKFYEAFGRQNFPK
jgi:hypothetical protein